MLFPIEHLLKCIALVFGSALANIILEVKINSSPLDDLWICLLCDES